MKIQALTWCWASQHCNNRCTVTGDPWFETRSQIYSAVR